MEDGLPPIEDTQELVEEPLRGKGLVGSFGSPVTSTAENQLVVKRHHKRSLFVMLAVGLLTGMVVPLLWFGPFFKPHESVAAESRSREPLRIAVVASPDQAPEIPVVRKKEEVAALNNSEPKEIEPSRIVEHAQQREISLDPRQFLYSSNSQREYLPKFSIAPLEDGNDQYPVEAGELNVVAGKNGRYKSSRGMVEWQGNWKFDDADKNLEVGQAYNKYLEDVFEGPFNRKLSVTGNDQSRILDGVAKKPAQPMR